MFLVNKLKLKKSDQMNKIHKEKAIEVLKEILHMFHEKRFEDVVSCVDESKIDDLGNFLLEFMQGTLELNHFDKIDEYGVECSFKPWY